MESMLIAIGIWEAPKLPPPPVGLAGLLDSLPAPALLALSLLATVLVMCLGSWAMAPRERSSAPSAARAPTAAAGRTARAAHDDPFYAFEQKMLAEGCSPTAIAAFRYNYTVLRSGADLMIGEAAIAPVDALPTLAELTVAEDASLLEQTVMLKLNGGLGTGMGLDKAKSLLVVKGGDTFLDLIAKQLVAMRERFGSALAFMVMNSFATSEDTLGHLAQYDFLPPKADLEFVQNKAPKVAAADLAPASWPADRSHEWCPPGHGDLYPAMVGSGTLDKLLARGVRYMFVSNSDNLGATMDLKLLSHFVASGAPFMMECAERTDADKKGGHLAKDAKTGALLLRESAQCPAADDKAFQDVGRYKYFNTNNLWVDLRALKSAYDAHGGALPLPVMKNGKTVDPRDKGSSKVLQLETAMGSAISCFDGAIAVCIPRTRFAPVKTCADLLALRSDAYVLTADFRIELAPSRKGVPPTVTLDDSYKFVDQLDQAFPHGAPSLVKCAALTVAGPVVFSRGVIIRGAVRILNSSGKTLALPAGAYEDITVDGPPLYDPTTFTPKYPLVVRQ